MEVSLVIKMECKKDADINNGLVIGKVGIKNRRMKNPTL
jgi:hypothetical protein